LKVVADSSPIISCARAKKLHLIKDMYSNIIIPPAVYRETVIDGSGKPGYSELKNSISVWIEVKEPVDKGIVSILNRRFGDGESEAIALAKELGLSLLVDEIRAMNEARRRGINILSTLIMLLEAKKTGLISSVKSELDELIASGFRCSAALYEEVLMLSHEI
jgi:predicted nucleic acid-binding protein